MADQARGIAFPLYQRVATERARQGWTWTRLTVKAGVARSTINSWAHIQTPPQPEKVNAVADLLGIPRMEALRLAGILADDGAPEATSAEEDGAVTVLRKALSVYEQVIMDSDLPDDLKDALIDESRKQGVGDLIAEYAARQRRRRSARG